ncbi:hypothetical protein Q5752_006332 [Cryptotrichosporon argae]
MVLHLLAGAYRPKISLLAFTPPSTLDVVSHSATPANPSWVEVGPRAAAYVNGHANEDDGLALSLELDGDRLTVTGRRKTGGSPAHVHVMRNGTGIVVSNYLGGSLVYFPITAGALPTTSDSPVLDLPYTYAGTCAPDPERQEAAHAHHVVEAAGGLLLVADLGGDRVWLVRRAGESALDIVGQVETPPGFGPRHMAISNDGEHLYVLGEMAHAVIAFSLADIASTAPLPFYARILPPTIPELHAKYMDSAEIVVHPHLPELYVSNRLEARVDALNAAAGLGLPPLNRTVTGDAIAVVVLGSGGASVEAVRWVRTGCQTIRGMQLSPDGEWAAVAGEDGGGVEMYRVRPAGAWELMAKRADLEKVADFAWL